MAVHSSPPDYALEDVLKLTDQSQVRALFEETRSEIANLLLERAATISELARALDQPKGTIGHHVGVLREAGLIQVVRTEKVRALEAKYYGRTARTFEMGPKVGLGVEFAPDYFLSSAASEYARAAANQPEEAHESMLSTLRYARIPSDRAQEWAVRLGELAQEFVTESRGGDTTFGLLIAIYPTDRPHLPDPAQGE